VFEFVGELVMLEVLSFICDGVIIMGCSYVAVGGCVWLE